MSGSKRVRPLEQSLVHFSCVSPCAGRPALFFYGSNGRCSSSTYKSRYWFGGVQLTCLNLKNSHVLRLVEFKDPKHKHPPPQNLAETSSSAKKDGWLHTESTPRRPQPSASRASAWEVQSGSPGCAGAPAAPSRAVPAINWAGTTGLAEGRPRSANVIQGRSLAGLGYIQANF